jgi:hypothetical protein
LTVSTTKTLKQLLDKYRDEAIAAEQDGDDELRDAALRRRNQLAGLIGNRVHRQNQKNAAGRRAASLPDARREYN